MYCVDGRWDFPADRDNCVCRLVEYNYLEETILILAKFHSWELASWSFAMR